jgi:phosphoenolpyruvate-protein kinase (PTS system EI component)
MAKEIPSVGDLRRKSEVTDNEIAAAAAAYLKDENAKPFAFKSGHTVDVAKAIEMHPQAKKLLADNATTVGLRRTMVMTAVIMGLPVQG